MHNIPPSKFNDLGKITKEFQNFNTLYPLV